MQLIHSAMSVLTYWKCLYEAGFEWFGMPFHICSSLVSLDPTAGIHHPFPEAPKASKPVRYCQSHRAREIKLEERV